MGILIVAIVGAIMGWLIAIVLDLTGTQVAVTIGAGTAGAVVAAFLSGGGALIDGLSPMQLLSGAFGAALAIVSAVFTAYRSQVRSSRMS